MARKLTTADRVMLLMSLVPYLKENGPTSVVDLARMFAVDPTELRHLVRFLGVAGVPGETQTYQHEDLFDIDWEALEQHDQVSLTRTVAVDETPRFSSIETAALTAGLHALVPLLPHDLRDAALSTAEKLAQAQPIEPRQHSVSLSEDPMQSSVTDITSAISRALRLSFEYRDEQGTVTKRTVEPFLLSQSGGAWYLRAYCLDRMAQRTFMVDRIRDMRVLDEPSTHVEPEPGARALTVEGAQLTARVQLSRSALHRIADFVPKEIEETETGWVRAEVALLHPAVAVRLVQAAPGEIIIESPAAARDAVSSWATRALIQADE